MLKKFFFGLVVSFIFLLSQTQAALANTVNAHLFYGDGCPHCAKESQFLNQLVNEYPELKIHEYEIYYDAKNNQLLQKVANKLEANAGGKLLWIRIGFFNFEFCHTYFVNNR